MSNAPARTLALLAALACGAGARAALAQGPAAKEAPASVEGRVTDGERGLPGVVVALLTNNARGNSRAAARARTDHEGRYRVAGVPPGRYQVLPMAPTFVLGGQQPGHPPGRLLTLAAGETIEDVDFRLSRGGVITGRVTDADGRPVVSEQVHLTLAETPQAPAGDPISPQDNLTDDRGVYRIYGLAAGSYHVSVGHDAATGMLRPGGSRRVYRRTFHPDAPEASKARVVRVEAGGEATEVDITLGPPVRTYKAAGRFLAPDGRPAAGAAFGYGMLNPDAQDIGMSEAGLTADARGEFLIEGLAAGRYAVFAVATEGFPSDSYSDAVTFEVDGDDVSGLEVKLRRAASVSGVIQIEGTSDRATLARLLRQVRLHGYVDAAAPAPPNYAQSPAGPDGSFRLAGLRPGRLRVGLGWPNVPGLVLTRVELNGADQRQGFEVAEGAQVTGVRVVLAYGNAVVRGQINLMNGALAPDERLVVFARRGGGGGYGKGAEADARGRFVLEGMAAGDYELTARVFTPRGTGQQARPVQLIIPETGEVSVTLTLDLGSK